MRCFCLIYTYLSTMFILTLQSGDPVTIFQPLQRVTHFTKFDFQFKNKSSGTIYECSYKQIASKQMLFFHALVHEKLIQIHAIFSVFKCHESYVDCVNVISYEICDLCSKLQLLSHFVKLENSKETLTACPIVGEYNYKNMTIEADTFGSIFGIPTENWFEYYWKINVIVFD
ncbi:uncharacterized protein LOC132937844 [Metopolophium dirhodum]|uniref:uncharacterized protein LOC132937844 n=1 Tax=Metopolophium dirhodum TaxID=44670 RepID=UPI00298F81E6|nr:uncharacterized protein LOC132937844 [Metopolophium dirhodum]